VTGFNQRLSNSGKIVVISGPSGSGKGTIINKLLKLQPELMFSVSATTRRPRPGESDGIEYIFLTHERFREMINSDEFLEYAEYVGEFYGTPALPVKEFVAAGKTVILDIEVEGAKQVMKKLPEAITIFIVPPNFEELSRRLRGRKTETDEKIAARIARAKVEMEEIDKYDYIVFNDTVSHAADEILRIIGNH